MFIIIDDPGYTPPSEERIEEIKNLYRNRLDNTDIEPLFLRAVIHKED